MGQQTFRNFHMTPELAGWTLAAALRRWRSGDSWSQVRRLIQNRHVQINGNLCLDDTRPLAPTDVVKVWEHPLAPVPKDDDVRIDYLDAHLVVVEKPAGMTTLRHPEERRWPQSRKDLHPTLAEVLPRVVAAKERSGKARAGRRGQPPLRQLRAVHRLDRDTSGLMVFARTPQAERGLVHLFRKHTIHRAYRAIVLGAIAARTIETRLIRDRGDGRRGSTADTSQGQRAVTHVRPLESLGEYTLVECRLETGRTHQIRIHLSELGHGVCGDKVYDKPLGQPARRDESGAPRLALHAAELGFEHPITGETLHFEAELPTDLARFLASLRKRAAAGDQATR